MKVSVREMIRDDIELVLEYFTKTSPENLLAMGANPKLIPKKEQWTNSLYKEFDKPISNKDIYYVIWQIDDKAIGHSNINKIIFGSEAYMHLHMWNSEYRGLKLGSLFIKKSINYYFQRFKLKRIICEPYALNLAPTKTLEKAGFKYIREHETIPSRICFKQKVRQYILTRDMWKHY